ncbi:MAG: hypothetical protein H6624_00675 [Bdellovibrionaceae bacterium]|nr:hypothetical protein [Bdellovibrionales bacterium]MCB9082822.1 hypothetical protein [Pseudobdellovibrionaceae bacterium]
MRELGFFLGNYLLFLAITALLAGLECSLWLQLFGDFPGPNLWVPTLVFWSLYRRAEEGVPMIYLLTLLLGSLTATSGGIFLLVNVTLFAVMFVLKQRIYTSGATNFMLICGAASFSVPLLHTLFSWGYEDNPLTNPAWFHWALEPLLTMLAALPLLQIFYLFDHLTHKERPKEMEALGHE